MADRPMPELEGVDHRFVDAGGLKTHVAEAGEGPPIVMLHGWPQNWWMWRSLIGPLAASGRRVICPDLRGYGWTGRARLAATSPEVFARDIAALIEAVSPDQPVDLVGHDWGGFTGFLLCLERPELVRRFLALNILHPFVRPSLNTFMALLALLVPVAARPAGDLAAPVREAGGQDRDLSRLGRRAAGPLGRARPRDLHRASSATPTARWAPRSSTATPCDVLPGILRGRYRDRTLETETLLLFGVRDRVQHPSLIPGFEANAPNMRVELVKASHFIVDTRPDLVLDRARELFEPSLTLTAVDRDPRAGTGSGAARPSSSAGGCLRGRPGGSGRARAPRRSRAWRRSRRSRPASPWCRRRARRCPVIEQAASAPKRSSAPSAIASATSWETAPFSSISAGSTPSSSTFASFE